MVLNSHRHMNVYWGNPGKSGHLSTFGGPQGVRIIQVPLYTYVLSVYCTCDIRILCTKLLYSSTDAGCP